MLLRYALDRALFQLERRCIVPEAGLATGFGSVDRLGPRLCLGTVTAVAGDDAPARLDFLLAVAAAVAGARHGVLLVVSRPVEDVATRMLAMRSGIDAKRLTSGPIERSERHAIEEGATWLWDLPVVLATDAKSLKVAVTSAASQLKDLEAFPALVILDGVEVPAELKAAAREEGVVVLVGGSFAACAMPGVNSLLRLDTLRAAHSAVHVSVHRNRVCLGGVTLSYDPACGRLVDDENEDGIAPEGGSARWWQEECPEDPET